MPKMKTKSAATKRFTKTASGEIKFKHTNKNHKVGKKNQSRIRTLRKGGYVDSTMKKNVSGLIGE